MPKDQLAYFVSDMVDRLDLSAIESMYEEERGESLEAQPVLNCRIVNIQASVCVIAFGGLLHISPP